MCALQTENGILASQLAVARCAVQKQLGGAVDLEPYGSRVTGSAVPGTDIDIAVTGFPYSLDPDLRYSLT